MNRLSVIQKVIDAIGANSYLEIGVDTGKVLLNVKAPIRYGVDPEFKFTNQQETEVQQLQSDPILYEMESDSFFEKFAARDLSDGIDVAFVDGFHTYQQSLRDILNCLKYLKEGGVIIVHDCNPLNAACAFPIKESIMELADSLEQWEIPGWNGCWNGDVWKAIIHLRVEHDDLQVFTLDLDWGLGIISRGKSEKLKGISVNDIYHKDYTFLESNRTQLLNLKHPKYIDEYLATRTATDKVSNL